MDGDYSNPELRPMVRGGLKYFVAPSFNLSVSTNIFSLANKIYWMQVTLHLI